METYVQTLCLQCISYIFEHSGSQLGISWLNEAINLIGADKLPWTLPLYEIKKARLHQKLINHLETISGVHPTSSHFLTHNGLSEYIGKSICQYIITVYPIKSWTSEFIFMYHESASTMRNRINKIRLINAWYFISTNSISGHQNLSDLIYQVIEYWWPLKKPEELCKLITSDIMNHEFDLLEPITERIVKDSYM